MSKGRRVVGAFSGSGSKSYYRIVDKGGWESDEPLRFIDVVELEEERRSKEFNLMEQKEKELAEKKRLKEEKKQLIDDLNEKEEFDARPSLPSKNVRSEDMVES